MKKGVNGREDGRGGGTGGRKWRREGEGKKDG